MEIKPEISFHTAMVELVKFEQMQSKVLRDMRPVVQRFIPVVKSKTPVQSSRPFVTERGGNRRRPGHLQESIGVIESKSDSYARLYVGPRVRDGYRAWYAGLVYSGHNIYRNPSSARAKKRRSSLKRYRSKTKAENIMTRTRRNPWTYNAYVMNASRLSFELQKVVGNRLQLEIRMK